MTVASEEIMAAYDRRDLDEPVHSVTCKVAGFPEDGLSEHTMRANSTSRQEALHKLLDKIIETRGKHRIDYIWLIQPDQEKRVDMMSLARQMLADRVLGHV